MLRSSHRTLVTSVLVGVLRQALLLLLLLLPLAFLCHTPLSWDQALSLLAHCFVAKPVSSFLLLLLCSAWAATQVLLVVVCCLLELTWMFPGSLLRYHEKIHGNLLLELLQSALPFPVCWH